MIQKLKQWLKPKPILDNIDIKVLGEILYRVRLSKSALNSLRLDKLEDIWMYLECIEKIIDNYSAYTRSSKEIETHLKRLLGINYDEKINSKNKKRF